MSTPHSPVSISQEQMGPGHCNLLNLGLEAAAWGSLLGIHRVLASLFTWEVLPAAPRPSSLMGCGGPRPPPDSLLRAAALE